VKAALRAATFLPIHGFDAQMADASTTREPHQAEQPPRLAAPNVDPEEVARRELVDWCKAHGLPVPPERPPQRRR
jgi:hypothetical protein